MALFPITSVIVADLIYCLPEPETFLTSIKAALPAAPELIHRVYREEVVAVAEQLLIVNSIYLI
jgi:hypothetical protein